MIALSAAPRPGTAEQAERIVVILVAAHTLAVGILLLFAPRFALRFAGWGAVEPLFFPRQAGAFHLVLALGYLGEHFRDRGVSLIVAAKAVATLFLLAASAQGGMPWAIPFSGVADGIMGAAAFLVHRQAAASRHAAGRRGTVPI